MFSVERQERVSWDVVSERFAGPVVIEYGWMNVLKCGIVLFAENGFRSLL